MRFRWLSAVAMSLVMLLAACSTGGAGGPSAADRTACAQWQALMTAHVQNQTDEQGIAQYTSLMASARVSLTKADDSALRASAQAMNGGTPTDPATLMSVAAACRRAGIDVTGAVGQP